MNTRKITVIAGILFLIVSIVAFSLLTGNSDEAESENSSAAVEVSVPVLIASPSSVNSIISFTGTVIPEETNEIYAEVSGRLEMGTKLFKTGTYFSKGEVLLQVENEEEKQALFNQKSQFKSLLSQTLADIKLDYPDEYPAWKDYLENLKLDGNISPFPDTENDQFNLFLAGRDLPATYYSIKQSEVRLDKYTVIAPFNGVVTESLVDPGALVRLNQRLGEFIKSGSYEIEGTVNASERSYVSVGDPVMVSNNDKNMEPVRATIERINSKIDQSTQSVLIYLKISGNSLLPGDFVSGEIQGQTFENAQTISSKSLVRDRSIFTLKDSIATLTDVTVLSRIADSVIISGLSDGDIIVDEFRDASFEGTKVIPLKKDDQ